LKAGRFVAVNTSLDGPKGMGMLTDPEPRQEHSQPKEGQGLLYRDIKDNQVLQDDDDCRHTQKRHPDKIQRSKRTFAVQNPAQGQAHGKEAHHHNRNAPQT
jgi:hypothetical protein